MANRWLRKADTRTGFLPTDPVSRQLAGAVNDVRNAQLLEKLTGGSSDMMSEILKPALQKMGEKLAQQMDGGASPTQQDTNSMLNDYLKQRLTMKQLDALDREAPTTGAPKDVMEFAKGAVDIQQGAAQTAIQMADMERQRRIETEEEMGGAIQHARMDEQQKANQQIEMMDKMYANIMAMAEKMADQRFQFAETLHQNALGSIQKQAQEAIDSLKSTFQEALTTKEQVHQKDVELIKKDHELALARQQAAMPLNQSPEYLWQLLQVEAAKAERTLELQQKQEQHQSTMQTHQLIREQLPEVIKTLGSVFGGAISVDNPLAGGGAPPPPTASGLGIGG